MYKCDKYESERRFCTLLTGTITTAVGADRGTGDAAVVIVPVLLPCLRVVVTAVVVVPVLLPCLHVVVTAVVIVPVLLPCLHVVVTAVVVFGSIILLLLL